MHRFHVKAHSAMAAAAALLQLARVELDSLMLGIEISAIREIIRVGEITPVPDAPASVRGVINLRGEVVTVVDLRAVLQLPPARFTPQTRLMIVQSDQEYIGLIVDRVADVVDVDTQERESLPSNMVEMGSRFFTAVYKLDAHLILVLDVATTLNAVCA